MLERHIQLLATDCAEGEAPAATRDRLKSEFPPGATRRMTTLGLLVGSVLSKLGPGEEDGIVYASAYGESRALEGFLDSFPTPSPTLFQTSIHPSAVQQLLIGRQCPVGEFLPLSGGPLLSFHALRACLLSQRTRVLLCGGEESGTWLLEHGLASERTFAFAAALTLEPGAGSLGRVRLSQSGGTGSLRLERLFEILHAREDFTGMVAPGWQMALHWEGAAK